MSYCEDSNINKSYIVQNVESSDIFSACTEIYLTNITPCTGDTININSNLSVIGDISGTTFYGDGSKLSGIITTDNYVTGGVYTASTKSLYFTGTTGFTPFSVDVSALLDDTNNYVTGGTLSGNDLILEKNNGVDVNPIDLSGLVSGKTDLSLFNSHTGDTNNPHQTSFSNLTSTAHTHTISEVINLQSELDSKTNNTDFVTHTGDTSIHFTKGSINLSDLGSTAHTHTLSDITDFNSYSGSVQTQLDGKVETNLFNSHTGDTNNPHQTSFSNLIATAHTHNISDVINLQTELDNKLDVSTFNTYSGNVQTELNTKISGATNLSSEGIFAQKNGLDLEFKGITSTGGTVNISSNSSSVNLEVTFPTDQDKFVSGGTYNGGTKEINFVGNSVDTTFDVDLTSLVSSVSANTYVIDGVYNDSTDTLSLLRNDGNFVNITGITDTFTTGATYDNGTTLATFTKNDGTTYTLDLSTIDVNDTFVTGQTFSNSTYILSTTRNDGTTFNTDLSVLASDVYVVSGVYDVLTGVVTYTNSSGGTFQVSGFTTGMTDSYTTAANLNGETIEFDNNIQGSNLYSVSLTPILSGKTDLTLFNSHTGNTNNPHQTSFSNLTSTAHTHTISDVINLQTELDSKTNNTEFTSHTGDTTIHFTKSSINLSDLGSTAHTHTLSEITDFNSYSGSVQTQIDGKLNVTDFNSYSGNVQTQLDTKVENGINSGGANEVFSGKSGTDLYFRTLSGGSNTTISTIGDIIKVDVSVPVDTNTFVTGFTYDDINTFTISRNNGLGDLTSTISVLSGVTYYGDGSNLSGISTDNFYVIDGVYNDSTDTLSLLRNDGNFVNITGITDTFTTGGTYSNGSAIFTNNTGGTFNVTGFYTGFTGGVVANETTFQNGVLSNTISATTISATTYYGDGSNLTGVIPSLDNGKIFVGNVSNDAIGVVVTGDINITNTGVVTIPSDTVTYDKMQDITQKGLLGSSSVSGGTIEEIPFIEAYLVSGSANANLLDDVNNWDINGSYIGTSLTGTYQGQSYYNNNYWFTAVADDIWIRLIRG